MFACSRASKLAGKQNLHYWQIKVICCTVCYENDPARPNFFVSFYFSIEIVWMHAVPHKSWQASSTAVLTKSCHCLVYYTLWCTAPNLFELILVPCFCMYTKSTAVLTESYYLVYCTSTLWYWSSRTAYSCNFPMQLHAVLDQPTNKVSGNTSVAESGLLLWLICCKMGIFIWEIKTEGQCHLSSHMKVSDFTWKVPDSQYSAQWPIVMHC